MAKTTTQLASIIRVNHAGEYGAKRIYAGQLAAIKNPQTKKIIAKMAAGEEEHLQYFEKQMVERAVRPTVLQPIWHVGGWCLGAATALMGERAAMACTVAVESVIAEHYESQIEATENEIELQQKIKQFRCDEIEHHDIGIAHDAQQTPAYKMLYHTIRGITKLAIETSKRL
jgi:ubiquinone biosynthesis monooxygenase Coq7